MQVVGFHKAGRPAGSKTGIINIADFVSGAQPDFFNRYENGYRWLGLSAKEHFFTGPGLKTGTGYFYNIFTAGTTSEVKEDFPSGAMESAFIDTQ